MRGNKKCGAKIIINKQMLIGNNNCGDVMSSGSVKHPRAWGQYFKPYPFRSSERSGLQEEGTEYRPRFFGLSFGEYNRKKLILSKLNSPPSAQTPPKGGCLNTYGSLNAGIHLPIERMCRLPFFCALRSAEKGGTQLWGRSPAPPLLLPPSPVLQAKLIFVSVF